MEKYKDNYKTFFNHNNNNSHKKNDYIAHTSRKQYFKIENNKYNDNNFNDFFSNELINNKNSQTLNKFYNQNNQLHTIIFSIFPILKYNKYKKINFEK